jgi:hypothetical protein
MSTKIKNIKIRNATSGIEKRLVEVGGDTLVDDLATEYGQQLGLPRESEVAFRLKRTQKQLAPRETLEESEIKDNDVLEAFVKFRGASSEPT